MADAGGEARGGAEEGEGAIDDVRAEVEEEAGAGASGFFPGIGALLGAEAVEAGVDGDDAAEDAFGEELFDGEEVAIEAAVMEGGEDEAALRRRGR